jgi:16S rRNA (cytidine1402-2'-O)-methyltransferase
LGQRDVAVLREMTKRFEEHLRGTPAALRGQFSDRSLKGEVAVVVGPPADVTVCDELIAQRLDEAMVSMSPRDAVKMVAEVLGIQRKRVYDVMVLKLPDRR